MKSVHCTLCSDQGDSRHGSLSVVYSRDQGNNRTIVPYALTSNIRASSAPLHWAPLSTVGNCGETGGALHCPPSPLGRPLRTCSTIVLCEFCICASHRPGAPVYCILYAVFTVCTQPSSELRVLRVCILEPRVRVSTYCSSFFKVVARDLGVHTAHTRKKHHANLGF